MVAHMNGNTSFGSDITVAASEATAAASEATVAAASEAKAH